jgi:hypothetical protein
MAADQHEHTYTWHGMHFIPHLGELLCGSLVDATLAFIRHVPYILEARVDLLEQSLCVHQSDTCHLTWDDIMDVADLVNNLWVSGHVSVR